MAKSSVVALLSMSGFALALWIATFFVAWQWKKWNLAMGNSLDMQVGLINIDAEMNCKRRYLTSGQEWNDKACEFVINRLKNTSVIHVRDFACALESTTGRMFTLGCERLQALWVGSVTMMVAISFAMLMQVLANIFLAVFWFGGRKNRWRVSAVVMFWVAAMLPLAGLAVYGLYSGDITDIIQSAAGSVTSFVVTPQEGSSLSMGFIMAVCNTAFMSVIALLSMLWVKPKHARDHKSADADEDSDEEQEYGAGHGFAHAFGASAPLIPQQFGAVPPFAHPQQQQPGYQPYGY